MDQNKAKTFPAFARTEIHWTIINFTPNALESRRFTKHDCNIFPLMLSSGMTTNWTLSVVRKQSCISVYLTSLDLEADEITTLNFQVGIESEDGVVWLCEGDVDDWHAHNRLGRLFNFKELVKNLASCVTLDQKLKIVLRLDLVARMDYPSLSLTILDHLESLIGNEGFGNFTLVASDGKTFLVNRSLLAARSSVLEKMMNTNMREKQMNQAIIQDMTGPALDEFLRFICCGKSDHLDEFAVELLGAADKYDVSDLKPLCEAILANDVTLENLVETLVIADFYNAADLKQFCLGLLIWNRSLLEESDAWLHVSNELFNEITDEVKKDMKNPKTICIESNILVDFQF